MEFDRKSKEILTFTKLFLSISIVALQVPFLPSF